jgi:hypothetical protein
MNENLSFAVVDSGSGLFMKFALAEHVMFVVDDLGQRDLHCYGSFGDGLFAI